MKVAVFGCLHGMLNEMYEEVENIEKTTGTMIDFVIVCGDCQTMRHAHDLKCLAVPQKYKKVGDFPDYYRGVKKIPKLTIFVGGNHEASNYLMTLPYGGWVCENFYYLGYAGVIRYKGLRIAGVSGIYNYHSYNLGRYERLPLDEHSIRSVYHTRELDIFRLKLLSKRAEEKDVIDVFMSHDWPNRIYDNGNVNELLRFKPAFASDIKSRNGLGNPLTQPLIRELKPKRWFAAHLHFKFQAKVEHDKSNGRSTEFLSLNKYDLRNKGGIRHWREILDLTPSQEHDQGDNELYYDPEWLTVLRKTVGLEMTTSEKVSCPNIADSHGQSFFPTDEEIQTTIEIMNKTGGIKIPRNFQMSEPVIYDRPNCIQPSLDANRERNYRNPQSEKLCSRLELKTSKGSQATDPSNRTADVKPSQHVKMETSSPRVKSEYSMPAKRVKSEPTELDEDGCLPFFIDTKGD